jgi:hypothetical protein
MMSRDGIRSVASLVAGTALLLLGAVVPAHFRAVNESVLRAAGQGTGTVLDVAGRMLEEKRHGAARLLLEAGRTQDPARVESAGELLRVEALGRGWSMRWGGPADWLERGIGGLGGWAASTNEGAPPVHSWILRLDVREGLARALAGSTDPAVSELLGCRELEQTVLLPPVRSSAGQPMEAALLAAGSLVISGRMHPGLALDFERSAVGARAGKGSERLETGLVDLLGAFRFLDWEQVATVASVCPDLASLHSLVTSAGVDGANWPVLLGTSMLDGRSAGGVARFLTRHGTAGLADLRMVMGWGEGAVKILLEQGHRVERDGRLRLDLPEIPRMVLRAPMIALVTKYLIWVDGLFLVFLGLGYAWQATRSEAVLAFQPRLDFAVLAALTATAGIILFLVSERFIFERPGAPRPAASVSAPALRIRLRTDIPHVTHLAMNGKILGMLVVFFVIQFFIYVLGLSRLRHIRGQVVEDSVKLRLIDNEESMFDAPLYLGIGGSVLALVLRLTGFDDVSLMASYSSTLFGILFCFLLKVVHVRPYRQQLILESASREQS